VETGGRDDQCSKDTIPNLVFALLGGDPLSLGGYNRPLASRPLISRHAPA